MRETNNNPNQDIVFFAETNFRNQRRKFGIKLDDRRRHMYIMGKTGMGKTEVIKNMVIQDIRAQRGVAVVDPHGELVEDILDFIPSHRINDLIYFNPADLDHPIAFNILESVDPEYKHLIASGLMGVFTKIWANMWSARMEYILNNCILALLDSPGNTLLGINRLLVDKVYRKKIIFKIKDPVVKSFWVNEYANYNERFRTEAIAPIQNKVGQFLSSSVIRNIVGQTKSTIDMREVMDAGKILLLNLSKGKIGEDNSALLGAMMITKLQLAAMSRVDIPEKERRDFFLYVDEFQNFATESFADILSEARKYRLSLILAHQYIAQLTSLSSTGAKITKVKDAIFGNVGTLICFRVGAPDAEELVKEFEPYFTEEDLVNLTKYDIYLKLMIDGVASKPFSATTLPPIPEEEREKNTEKAVRISRERYSNGRKEVEEKILKWSGVEEMFKATAIEEKVNGEEAIYKAGHVVEKSKSKEEVESRPKVKGFSQKSLDKIEAICDNCGEAVKISFEPDEYRNVFCKECLKKFKRGEIDVGKLPKRNIKAKKLNDSVKLPISSLVNQKIELTSKETSEQLNQKLEEEKAIEQQSMRASSQKIDFLTPKETLVASEPPEEREENQEISLQEALNQKPISFHQKKAKLNETSENISSKTLKPGQIVRFE